MKLCKSYTINNQIDMLSRLLFQPFSKAEDRSLRLKKLFDYLRAYFPKAMQSPAQNLVDIVSHEYSWSCSSSSNCE
jgi:hypothetical protein